ncbi:AIR synthase family protein [Vulcanisaeta thermophila]|uniref:AIR synthase family protein n=1 Tax=Vulcanisaeta thermophila TaxID=867917 RepID=UPI00085385E1|nr:AIR synthase family protein [Vulcanisaeta thermophila]
MVKLSNELLRELVLTRTGVKDPAVIVGPGVGEDAAVVDLGQGKYLVTHTDPITGAVENLGWLAIHIPANDIAVRGVRPRWFLLTLLLPSGFDVQGIAGIMRDVDSALRELNAALIGGHTEYTPGIDRPIASVTAMGIGERYVTTSNARPGDLVLLTKYVALEGTSVLASDYGEELMRMGVDGELIRRARELIKEVSVVREALALADMAHSMHDPTEGGLIQGLLEVAEASGVRVRIYRDRVPILPETRVIFQKLGLDPLRSLSSGMLIATIPRERVDEALSRLNNLGVNAVIAGEVLSGRPALEVVGSDGSVEEYSGFFEDEIMRFIEARGKMG